MLGYSSPFYHQKGPDLLIRFYITKREICRIDLSLNSQTGLAWQMYSDDSLGPLESQICEWVENYAKKKASSFKLPLLMTEFSPFTKQVFHALQEIPFGQSLTYQQVAEKIGNPLASRAVGSACGRNPFLLVIPCHRILAAGSRLGGFTAGLDLKKSLLRHEGIILS